MSIRYRLEPDGTSLAVTTLDERNTVLGIYRTSDGSNWRWSVPGAVEREVAPYAVPGPVRLAGKGWAAERRRQ